MAPLGRTGIEVSSLCFGALTISPLQLNHANDEAGALIDFAFDHGINCLDTAQLYSNYDQIAQAKHARDLVLITKCHAFDREGAQQSIAQALEGTGRDVIDVMMLHEQESEWTLRGHKDALAYFYELRDQGKLRAVGISTHHIACVQAAAKDPNIDVIEAICNRKGIGICDGTQAQMNQALQAAHDAGKGIIGMKALGGGHLIGDVEGALSYCLAQPFMDTVALGCQSREEVLFALSVVQGSVQEELRAATARQPRKLHIASWCHGCGKCIRRCKGQALRMLRNRVVVDLDKCALCGYCASVCPEFCIKVY